MMANILIGSRANGPRHGDLSRAARLYENFNGFEPSSVVKVRHVRLIPPVVVKLGELIGVIYRSDKGQPGRQRSYVHFMQDPPILVSNVQGTQLYIVGGRYHVTTRGIEDGLPPAPRVASGTR
jgi:hypothetical protein